MHEVYCISSDFTLFFYLSRVMLDERFVHLLHIFMFFVSSWRGEYSKCIMHSYNFSGFALVSIFLKCWYFEKLAKVISKKTYETGWNYGNISEFLLAVLQKLSSLGFLLQYCYSKMIEFWKLLNTFQGSKWGFYIGQSYCILCSNTTFKTDWNKCFAFIT